jgi:hypothetical protein
MDGQHKREEAAPYLPSPCCMLRLQCKEDLGAQKQQGAAQGNKAAVQRGLGAMAELLAVLLLSQNTEQLMDACRLR